MSWLLRWQAEYRQRLRHYRPFWIAKPKWTAGERARLARLLEDLASNAQSTPDTPRADSSLKEKELAEGATNLWRARRRLARLNGEGSRDAKWVARYLDAAQEALDTAGLLIQDHDGIEHHPGLSLEVVAFQEDPALQRDVVLETVRPSIYLAGRRIQMGQVIVGCPVKKNNATTTEESRA
jgi:hypothetical protein